LRVAESGADAVVADVHHWLLGPEAVALVWLSPQLGEGLPAQLATASGPFGRGALLAAARSAGWLLMYVGLPWLVARTTALARRLREGLAGIDGVEVLGGPGSASALLAFRLEDWPDADVVADELSHRALAISDPGQGGGDIVRVSVGAWNTDAELDRFVARVAELASAAPGTLPRRPSLTILGGTQGEPGP
jgi:selenocysteine lyase/cysteine desulfurase